MKSQVTCSWIVLVICFQWALSLSNNQEWLLAVGPFEFMQIQWCNTINANWSAESKVHVIHCLIQLNTAFKFECLLATNSTTIWRTPVIKALSVWTSFCNVVVICTFMQLQSSAMVRAQKRSEKSYVKIMFWLCTWQFSPLLMGCPWGPVTSLREAEESLEERTKLDGCQEGDGSRLFFFSSLCAAELWKGALCIIGPAVWPLSWKEIQGLANVMLLTPPALFTALLGVHGSSLRIAFVWL